MNYLRLILIALIISSCKTKNDQVETSQFEQQIKVDSIQSEKQIKPEKTGEKEHTSIVNSKEIPNELENLNPITNVALRFINGYVNNCNKMKEQVGIIEWVESNPYASENLKSELKRIIEEANIAEPDYGLGFDPIFNAQDYPDEGFKLVDFDTISGIVNVKDKILDGFNMPIKLVKENDKWFVNGVGIINSNNFNASEDYKWVKQLIINDEHIGELYNKPVNDSIFESLIIINKSDTIYKIDKLHFWNQKGPDFNVSKDTSNFYGYSFLKLNNDSFVLNYYSDKGKNIADNITVIWNEANRIFEVMITP